VIAQLVECSSPDATALFTRGPLAETTRTSCALISATMTEDPAAAATDQLALLAAIMAIGAEDDVDGVGQRTIAELVRLIPSTVVTLNEVDIVAQRFRFWTAPADFSFTPDAAAAWDELAPHNPLLQRYQRTGDGSAYRFSDVWSAEEYHASELYRRVYAPMGIEHQMAFTVPDPQPVVIAVVLNRATPDYSERDRAIVNLLRPHIAQAWRNARELELLRARVGSPEPAPEDGERWMVLLDGDTILEQTTGSLDLLHEHFDDAWSTRDRLPAPVRDWLAQERARMTATKPTLASTLSVRHGDGMTVVRRVPPTINRPETLLIRQSLPLAEVNGPLRSLGLTTREAEVFARLTSGATNITIGRQLGITPDTVKRHLGRVYRKLGVNGRVQAVRLALETFGSLQ
jgi:DNA-binding CsgD family transcriptional regulator